MELADGIAAFVEDTENFAGESWTEDASVIQQRNIYKRYCEQLSPPMPEGIGMRDATVPGPAGGVAVRVYSPSMLRSDGCVIYFHGGGFVVGDLDTHNVVCASIAFEVGCRVIAVDYRLAPENIYPAALDDAWAALEGVRANAASFGINADKIVVAGDSAGGTLAAGVALRNRDTGGAALAGQVLFYPALGAETNLPAHQENADAPMLTVSDMHFYFESYCPSGEIDAWGAPLKAANFANLPPAFIAVCQYDPLRDDGVVFHEKLQAAGVKSTLYMGNGLVHSCLRATHRSQAAADFFQAGVQAVKAMLSAK